MKKIGLAATILLLTFSHAFAACLVRHDPVIVSFAYNGKVQVLRIEGHGKSTTFGKLKLQHLTKNRFSIEHVSGSGETLRLGYMVCNPRGYYIKWKLHGNYVQVWRDNNKIIRFIKGR